MIRISVAVLGGGALLMALKVQSVQALWFFTSDLVFVLLFPQLVYACSTGGEPDRLDGRVLRVAGAARSAAASRCSA